MAVCIPLLGMVALYVFLQRRRNGPYPLPGGGAPGGKGGINRQKSMAQQVDQDATNSEKRDNSCSLPPPPCETPDVNRRIVCVSPLC